MTRVRRRTAFSRDSSAAGVNASGDLSVMIDRSPLGLVNSSESQCSWLTSSGGMNARATNLNGTGVAGTVGTWMRLNPPPKICKLPLAANSALLASMAKSSSIEGHPGGLVTGRFKSNSGLSAVNNVVGTRTAIDNWAGGYDQKTFCGLVQLSSLGTALPTRAAPCPHVAESISALNQSHRGANLWSDKRGQDGRADWLASERASRPQPSVSRPRHGRLPRLRPQTPELPHARPSPDSPSRSTRPIGAHRHCLKPPIAGQAALTCQHAPN